MKVRQIKERDAGSFIGIERPRNGTNMPKPSDMAECRRMAEHYLTCARQMSDPDDRAALLQMAEYWARLAGELDKQKSHKSEAAAVRPPPRAVRSEP